MIVVYLFVLSYNYLTFSVFQIGMGDQRGERSWHAGVSGRGETGPAQDCSRLLPPADFRRACAISRGH